jgi:hypothetical protein
MTAIWYVALHNNRLQRTVTDKVPRHVPQRAAAEPERYTARATVPEAPHQAGDVERA